MGLADKVTSCTYGMSKSAMRSLTKSTAIQYASEGIRVNSILPGVIETRMTADRAQKLLKKIPLGHVGQPEDVAYGALYLASDESSFVTGSDLVIDGGATAGR